MLLVDAANVVGSRPTGWWRDRPGAARNLHRDLLDAVRSGRLEPPVVVILEGAACGGVAEGDTDGVQVRHARGEGDDTIVAQAGQAVARGETVTVVTADRELRARISEVPGEVVGPRWLLDRLAASG